MTSVQLRAERADKVKRARAILDKAKTESRDLSTEETQEYDRIIDDVDKAKAKIDRMEKLETLETEQGEPQDRTAGNLSAEQRYVAAGDKGGAPLHRQEYRHWLRTGEVRGSEFRTLQQRLVGEYRDTIIGTDSKGGYLIVPTAVSPDLVKQIDDEVFLRRLGTITTVTEAKKLGIRKMTTRMADADWTTEVAAVTEDTTMAFDRRDLEPYLLTKLSKVSIRTLTLAADAESEVNTELAYKFGITEEKAFLSGNGSSKPLGVFTASASGISTGRDVSTDNTSTALTADGLINAKYAVKQAYLNSPKAGWIFHRDAVKMIRKLKASGTGDYIWQPGIGAGAPDRILELPYYMSEYAPNTFTTGLYVGIVGNFSYYRIAELNVMFMQRLVERYADTNEVGFIGRRFVDGAPVLEEAFARVKLA